MNKDKLIKKLIQLKSDSDKAITDLINSINQLPDIDSEDNLYLYKCVHDLIDAITDIQSANKVIKP